MPITSIHIRNFKGICEDTALDLRPLNFFIGPNSSGKSSCIHALAALSQTVKIPNNLSPLMLDGEYAHVHLGRFIEVVHSKNYTDSITLGVSVSLVPMWRPNETGKMIRVQLPGEAKFQFKSTKRTQEVHLSEAAFTIGDQQFNLKLSGESYLITERATSEKTRVSALGSGFLLDNPAMHQLSINQRNTFLPLLYLNNAIRQELTKVAYLGPFRQPPSRRYPTRGSSPTEVGASGESTMTLLANEAIQSPKRKHIRQIQNWLRGMGLGAKIDVSRVATSDLFDISVSLDDGRAFPLADLGFGLSQVLPVLTQCSFASQGALLLFEQPELHLHTVSAKKLVNVFIDTVKEKNVRILAETHSPDMIYQIQQELRKGTISLDDVGVYRVTRENSASKITQLTIEDDASIYSNWESGLTRE